MQLPPIDEPFSYRVAVGKLMSEEYRVTVRYPLRLQQVEVDVTPPAYTGLEPTTLTEGSVQATEGSTAVFRFRLDRAAVSAKLLLSDPRGADDRRVMRSLFRRKCRSKSTERTSPFRWN